MAVVVDIARYFIAVIFVVASGAKIADRSGTRRAVIDFGVPERFASVGAILVPVIESATAVLLIIERTSWIGGVVALALLAGFSAAIGANLGRGRHPACHCFGRLSSTPVGADTLWRNLALGVAPLIVILWG